MHVGASLRFPSLTQTQSAKLQAAIREAVIDVHYPTGKNVGSVRLKSTSQVVRQDEFRRRHQVHPGKYDVFVAIASEKRDEVWRAPRLVNYVVNIVNCPIVFSYSC